MQAKYMTSGLLGAISLAGMISTIGCGGGSRTNLAPAVGATRLSLLTKFNVDVKTGKVRITRLDSKRRAVLTGGAISFTSSDLLNVGGDSGKRLVHVNVVNNTNEVTPATMRLIVGSLTNSSTADILGNTITSTFAGSGTAGSADGYATSATFNAPADVATNSGAVSPVLYVADTTTHIIRKMTDDGTVTTFAGTAGVANSTDGTGSAARFSSPRQVAMDQVGNVYVADTGNQLIRRITPLGEVTQIAGIAGTAGNADGIGNVATFNGPRGIATSSDGSNIYVTDFGSHIIRRLTWDGVTNRKLNTAYTVTTIAGTAGSAALTDGNGAAARFNSPVRLALIQDPSGDNILYVADNANHAIRRIASPDTGTAVVSTAAGTGTAGTTDGVAGSAAQFSSPSGITAVVLQSGVHAIYVTENGTSPAENRIRQIIYTPGNEPQQKGNYMVNTVSGAAATGSADGDGATARFNNPSGVCAIPSAGASVTLFVADTTNNKIRKVNVAAAQHSGGPNVGSVTETVRLVNWDSEVPHQTAWVKMITPAANGVGYTADLQFFVPSGVSGFSFTAYIEADTNLTNLPGVNNPAGTTTLSHITTLGGDGLIGDNIGPGKLTEFYRPQGIAAVPPNLQSAYAGLPQVRALIADSGNNRIKYLDVNGNVGYFAGSGAASSTDGMGLAATFNIPVGIAIGQDGSVFVCDVSGLKVRRIATSGNVTTIAGTGTGGFTDGAGNVAQFYGPAGLAIDSGGAIYITDISNNNVRKIVYNGGDPAVNTSYVVSTVAGPNFGTAAAFTDATGTAARFSGPYGIACDTDGKIYVADTNNHAVRLLTRTASGYAVTTVAGGPPPTPASGTTDANGTSARFNNPHSIALDTAHNLYIADYTNHRIRRMNPVYDVKTLIGGSSGFTDSTMVTAGTLNNPAGIAVESSGNVLVSEYSNHAVRVVQRVIPDAQRPSQ